MNGRMNMLAVIITAIVILIVIAVGEWIGGKKG